MTSNHRIHDFVSALAAAGALEPETLDEVAVPEAYVTVKSLSVEHWAEAARLAKAHGLRWAGCWADEVSTGYRLYVLLAANGQYVLLVAAWKEDDMPVPSQSTSYPAASRMERHMHDLLGIPWQGTTDTRRWTRHRAWEADQYPLRSNFPLQTDKTGHTPVDNHYPFEPIQGDGIYEIPVGPVHAGIIEPGHFRFQAAGEPILRLEERLGYVHKGIEKLAVGRDADSLVRLAGRVSGDSTVAYAWAAAMAIEQASGMAVSPRIQLIRGLLAERERVANHLGDIGAICNDVGFAFAHMQCQALREGWLRRNAEWTGHRLLMDVIKPGGIHCELSEDMRARLLDDHEQLRKEIRPLFDILDDHPSLEDRLLTTGYLSAATANELGVTGYVGKASGQNTDVRHDSPYGPYQNLQFSTATLEAGDVAARLAIRQMEIFSSLKLMQDMLEKLAQLPEEQMLEQDFPTPHVTGSLAIVDGWRGEILVFLRFDQQGKVVRFFPRDPSWFTWPALERIVLGNIVPDFPVCNKSVNASYSGHDL